MEFSKRLAPASAERRAVHLRRVRCEGFERTDGLFDIDGTLIDTKPFHHQMVARAVEENEPIHEMVFRITIDRRRTILDAQAWVVQGPYEVCGDIAPSYRQLIGMRIEPGFTERIKQLFRRSAGCTHLTELLPPMVTTAFQMLWSGPAAFGVADERGSGQLTSPIGGCHALREGGEVVRQYFQHLQPVPPKSG